MTDSYFKNLGFKANPFDPNLRNKSAVPSNFGFTSKVGSMSGISPDDYMPQKNPFEPKKTSNFLKNFTDRLGAPGFGKNEEGDTFAKRFASGLIQSYRPKERSAQEVFYDQLTGRNNLSGLAQPVAEGLTYMNDEKGQPTVVSGMPGEAGFFEKAGLAAIGGFFCDIRMKEDIAPLCESEVNNVLSECAYFVKDLNECS